MIFRQPGAGIRYNSYELEHDDGKCGLLPSPSFNRRILVPRVSSGERLKNNLIVTIGEQETEKRKALVEELTTAGACSLDILLNSFFDSDKPLKFPFTVNPDETVVAKTELNYASLFGLNNGSLCLEARSRFARKGWTPLGFKVGKNNRIFVQYAEELNFIFQNCMPFPVTVTEPFSPVQISEAKQEEQCYFGPRQEDSIKLFKNGQEVTEQNKFPFDYFDAFIVHCDDQAVYWEKSSQPVELIGDQIQEISKKVETKDIPKINPDFCLTLTQEEIHTNGCPAYIFPFHFLDALANRGYFRDLSSLSSFYYKIFKTKEHLPVTANSGLINPGHKGRIVCENITKGRNLEKYFKPGDPFAIIIPIPFHDRDLDNETYQGDFKEQKDIIF